MSRELDRAIAETKQPSPAHPNEHRLCRDFDEDCIDMTSVQHIPCAIYDPSQGCCPFAGCALTARTEGRG